MSKHQLTASQFRRLSHLSRQLSNALGFDVVPKRDAVTGAFTKGSSLTGKAVRAAWGLASGRGLPRPADAGKAQLLAAIRAGSIK